jgi:tetratricopeptide (TPR) repeat protein
MARAASLPVSENAQNNADPLRRVAETNAGAIPSRIESAKLLAESGDLAGAEQQLREVLKRDDSNFAALRQLAEILTDDARTQERLDTFARMARHEECHGAILDQALLVLERGQRWHEIRDVARTLAGTRVSEMHRELYARALSESAGVDEAVTCLRDRVLNLEDDVRDLVATLLAQDKPLIAGRLVASLQALNITSEDVRAARNAVKTFCRSALVGMTAPDNPLRFTDLVESLGALEPENLKLGEAAERGCSVLLNRAQRSLAQGGLAEGLAEARRAAAVRAIDRTNRIKCADILVACGCTAEAVALLLAPGMDDAGALEKAVALLANIDDWSGLDALLSALRQSPGTDAVLARIARRIGVALSDALDRRDAVYLLNTALALLSASANPASHSDLIEAVLRRSRRAIRRIGRSDRPLLEQLCKKHLALSAGDREVGRRYARLLAACGRHRERREVLRGQLQLDPHDEGMWSDLSRCCAYLGLKKEASDAANRGLALTPSGVFQTA